MCSFARMCAFTTPIWCIPTFVRQFWGPPTVLFLEILGHLIVGFLVRFSGFRVFGIVSFDSGHLVDRINHPHHRPADCFHPAAGFIAIFNSRCVRVLFRRVPGACFIDPPARARHNMRSTFLWQQARAVMQVVHRHLIRRRKCGALAQFIGIAPPSSTHRNIGQSGVRRDIWSSPTLFCQQRRATMRPDHPHCPAIRGAPDPGSSPT